MLKCGGVERWHGENRVVMDGRARMPEARAWICVYVNSHERKFVIKLNLIPCV